MHPTSARQHPNPLLLLFLVNLVLLAGCPSSSPPLSPRKRPSQVTKRPTPRPVAKRVSNKATPKTSPQTRVGNPPAPESAEGDFSKQADEILQEKGLNGAQIGVVVQNQRGTILFERDAKKGLIPASNIKVFAIATALKKLGPSYRFSTVIAGSQKFDEKGVLKGDLYIQGSGDPLLRSEELWRISRTLYNRGLRKVTGRIYYDDSFFDRVRFGKGWKDHDHERYRPYLAATSALSLNYNTLTVTVLPGSKKGARARLIIDPASHYVAKLRNQVKTTTRGRSNIEIKLLPKGKDRDVIVVEGRIRQTSSARTYWRRVSFPAAYTAATLAYFLRRQGIRISSIPGGFRAVPNDAVEYYEHKSHLLSTLLQSAGKLSSNLVTEQIVKTLGAKVHGQPGTWDKGLRVIREHMKEMGIAHGSYVLENGCGLGRTNRIAPLHITQALRFMHGQFGTWPEFLASYSIAGGDGTLRKRFQRSPLKAKLRGKTGSLDGVSTISGLLITEKQQRLYFAIFMNGKLEQTRAFRNAQNKLIEAMYAASWPTNQ